MDRKNKLEATANIGDDCSSTKKPWVTPEVVDSPVNKVTKNSQSNTITNFDGMSYS